MSKKNKVVEPAGNMADEAILSSDKQFSSFAFNGHNIRFKTSSRLEKYTRVVEWDHGYMVVMAKYEGCDEEEEYIDLILECIEELRPDITIHRITGDGPKDLLIAPLWSSAKRSVLNHIHHEMKEKNCWQGKALEQKGDAYGRSTDTL